MMRECEHCGATLDPQEICDCRHEETEEIALRCVTPPVIFENIAAVTAYIDGTLAMLAALPRDKEGCVTAKALRADLRRRFDALEGQRKAVKNAVMAPYLAAEQAYKEKISTPINAADKQLKDWIDSYQNEVKQNCRDVLQDYFDELCAVLHIDFVTFDQTGVVVDMATANLKDPKKARDTIHDFLNRIEDDRRTISTMEHAEEIMAEYKLTLSLSTAIATVNDRHKRIITATNDIRRTISPDIPQPVRQSPAILPPPVAPPEPEELVDCTFHIKHATHQQLKSVKEFLLREGICFE